MAVDDEVKQPTSLGDAIGVVSLFMTQLNGLEARLTATLKENSEAAQTRWARHETDHKELLRITADLTKRLDEHLAEEEREELVNATRLAPFKQAWTTIRHEWRTVLIIALLLANLINQLVLDAASRLVQPPPPPF